MYYPQIFYVALTNVVVIGRLLLDKKKKNPMMMIVLWLSSSWFSVLLIDFGTNSSSSQRRVVGIHQDFVWQHGRGANIPYIAVHSSAELAGASQSGKT